MGFRSRFAAWLESILPWYDQDRERAKAEKLAAQLNESRRVRLAVDHEIADSRRDRRDRRDEMRGSFRRAGQRLGTRL